MAGAYITLIGAAITLIINFLFIPVIGYMACAWATFFCYGSMMVISYLWGQKVYRVPYAWKKLCAYMVIVVLLYFIHSAITHFANGAVVSFSIATVLVLLYVWFITQVERKEFQKFPGIGKYF
jgi:O-antigen/teichoic acid export membrane protein